MPNSPTTPKRKAKRPSRPPHDGRKPDNLAYKLTSDGLAAIELLARDARDAGEQASEAHAAGALLPRSPDDAGGRCFDPAR